MDASRGQLRDELRRDVRHLATEIGPRDTAQHDEALRRAADWIDAELSAAGYEVQRQQYDVLGNTCDNLDAQITGTTRHEEIVIVGAHYDAVAHTFDDPAVGTPGANDNASGVAALLALARRFAGRKTERTLRFVAFTNEEPPYFQTDQMGSLVYARRCRRRNENLTSVVILETLGYYTNRPNSQQYPPPIGAFYPSTGNFVAVVGNVDSRRLVRRVVDSFRRQGTFPCEGGAVPGNIDGVGWSDHWSFWQAGYEAVMLTDTAPFRYPYYHHTLDTPDKLSYDEMARVVDGLGGVIAELAGAVAGLQAGQDQ